MADFNYLCCNIDKCKILLTEKVWVTRCLHIFCPEHGHNNFSNRYSQVNCPVCNEVIVKETDVALCDVNPSEMVLAGLSPEKAVAFAAKAVKLWKYQTEAEHAYSISKFNDLNKKYNENKFIFEKSLHKIKIKYEAEIAGLKAYYDEVGEKLREVCEELQETKRQLKKYQMAYNSLKSERTAAKYNHRRIPDLDVSGTDNIFFTPVRNTHGSSS